MHRLPSRGMRRLTGACVLLVPALFAAPAAFAQASASSQASLTLEQPVGGSFAFDTVRNVLTAVFLQPASVAGAGKADFPSDATPSLYSRYVGDLDRADPNAALNAPPSLGGSERHAPRAGKLVLVQFN